MEVSADRCFTKKQLKEILDNVKNKTLGEVDVKNVFAKTIANPKITGIAGMVIEQSVLGYKADSKKEADICVDGVMTEVKTTGLKKLKDGKLTAKEPISITAVSIDKKKGIRTIDEESDFEDSAFFHKIDNMLFVFYFYGSLVTVPAADYAKFKILGHRFHEFSEFSDEDKERLRNDWQLVHDFVVDIKQRYNTEEERKQHYPNLSTLLNDELMVLDTAPKYPNPPRFRFRSAFAKAFVEEWLGIEERKKLATPITKFSDIDKKCHEITEKYKGLNAIELFKALDICDSKPNGKGRGEQIVIRMFGQTAKKINDISDFAKIGLIAKTITTKPDGSRKEDTKCTTIDFDEWQNKEVSFEESPLYEYFNDHTFLFIIFKQDPTKKTLSPSERSKYDIFCGFKRYKFPHKFIMEEGQKTWDKVRELIFCNTLKVEPIRNSWGVIRYTPTTGVVMEAPNFPKKEDGYNIFLRGSGTDSSPKYKTLEINGLKMLPQNFWINGKSILDQLRDVPFL
jgi:hypothetical protein